MALAFVEKTFIAVVSGIVVGNTDIIPAAAARGRFIPLKARYRVVTAASGEPTPSAQLSIGGNAANYNDLVAATVIDWNLEAFSDLTIATDAISISANGLKARISATDTSRTGFIIRVYVTGFVDDV